MFAPKAAMKLTSYLTGKQILFAFDPGITDRFADIKMVGWLTVIGWQATFATSCYLVGTLIQGLITLTQDSYQPQNWHGTLLFWAVAVFSLVVNLIGGILLPRFEGLILVLHLIGFFAILIPLITTADHGSANEVFTHFLNLGEFPSQGLSFFVGMVGCMFAFAGGDAAVHVGLSLSVVDANLRQLANLVKLVYQMSEEITNASTAVPASIMLSVLVNGSLGFGMLIAMLFCLGDIELALESPTGYPFMSIFLQATGSVAGTAVMGSIITTMGISTSVGMLATTSRQFWSFARDRGIPGWRIWSQVGLQFPLIASRKGYLLGSKLTTNFRFMVKTRFLFIRSYSRRQSPVYLLSSTSAPRLPSTISSPCPFQDCIFHTWL